MSNLQNELAAKQKHRSLVRPIPGSRLFTCQACNGLGKALPQPDDRQSVPVTTLGRGDAAAVQFSGSPSSTRSAAT
jgi:hypothetical protein